MAFALSVLPWRGALAQEAVIQSLRLDRLQLVSLGAGFGSIRPTQVEATSIFGIAADYGQISPAWRMQFRISYWESRFRSNVIAAFADTLQKNLVDPTATSVKRSPISVYDASFSFGARRLLAARGDITPFFSGGVAGHVINAEGDFIKGTFVERALDDIAAGAYGDAGVRVKLLRRVHVEGLVRADLLSGFRSVQWMAIGSYYFGEPRTGGSER